jgi:hypothetical protein
MNRKSNEYAHIVLAADIADWLDTHIASKELWARLIMRNPDGARRLREAQRLIREKKGRRK